MEQKLLDILKEHWGYDSFRPMQREIIESVLGGQDTLALMPTGGGKSITYQLPTLAQEGLCIVVTPLISLMKDQVDALRKRGIPAVAVHSGLSSRQIDIALDNCVYGDTKFLYVAPERLSSEVFRLRVDRMNVCLLAIDEAHCISQWGHDFRPSYLRIAELREILPSTPILALTASATSRVTQDIMTQLRFANPHILQSSFARPNLCYCVRHTNDKEEQLMRVINNVEGCGIVYVRKRETAEKVSKWLVENGVSASYYHGGLPSAERTIRQDEWSQNKIRIMVATNAFGMGIDKSDVRFVVHYSMPDSLESYYQEAGRAGRDGKRSYAVLLKGSDDESRVRRTLDDEFPTIDTIRRVYETLCSLHGIAIGDGKDRSIVFNIHELYIRGKFSLNTVLNSLKLLQLNGYLTYISEHDNPARIIFNVSRDDIYNLQLNEKEERIITSIMRLYTGIFTEFRPIDISMIATSSRCNYAEVHECLRRLWTTKVITYIPANNTPMLFFDEERLPTRDVRIAPETYSLRKELMFERFDHLLDYVNNDTECRHCVIERYFCDSISAPCGVCDICIEKRKSKDNTQATSPEERILEVVDSGEYTVKELVRQIKGNEEVIVETISRLINDGVLRITNRMKVSR